MNSFRSKILLKIVFIIIFGSKCIQNVLGTITVLEGMVSDLLLLAHHVLNRPMFMN